VRLTVARDERDNRPDRDKLVQPVVTEAHEVFTSYSWDSEDHERRVLALVTMLRREGVDAWVDKYEPSPPEGWPWWCDRQVEAARFVLVVCTERYKRLAMRQEQPGGRGRGAAWEAATIINELYDLKGVQDKYIAVVFSPDDADHVPRPLKGWSVHDVSRGVEELLKRLTGQPPVKPPPLGRYVQLPKADLDKPRPIGDPATRVAPPPPPVDRDAAAARLAEVIEGVWIVEQRPEAGSLVFRFRIRAGLEATLEGVRVGGAGSPFGPRFFIEPIIGPPYFASGTWEILPPGNRLALHGTSPHPETGAVQGVHEFLSVTEKELVSRSVYTRTPVTWSTLTWRREE
jgi:hypothetical protein